MRSVLKAVLQEDNGFALGGTLVSPVGDALHAQPVSMLCQKEKIEGNGSPVRGQREMIFARVSF